jgi:hypothetical protein
VSSGTATLSSAPYGVGMTVYYARVGLIVGWLVAAMVVSVGMTPTTAAAWLTWVVLGLAMPLTLWLVTMPAEPSTSEAIHRARN